MAVTSARLGTLLAATAMLPAAGVPPAPRDGLRFAPEPGARIAKTFHRTLEVELSGTQEVRWKDNGPVEFPLEMRLSCAEEQWVELVDEHLEKEGNHPPRLRRTMARLSGELKERDLQSGRLSEERGRGILEGATVLFALDDESLAHAPCYEIPDEHDEALLADLEGDADLLGILPEKPVRPGDEWSVRPELLRQICLPGGAIAYAEGEQEQVLLEPWLEGAAEGRLRVRYAGEPSVGGTVVALLEVKGDVEIRGEPLELPGGPVLFYGVTSEGTDRIELGARFDVEGEVLWDLEAGRLFDADLEARVALDMDILSRANDGSVETHIRACWEGSLRVGASFRGEELDPLAESPPPPR